MLRGINRPASMAGIFLAVALHAGAVDNPPLEKVLLPIVVDGEVSGAYGSRWASRIAVTNFSASEVAIDAIQATGCNFDPCVRPTPRLQPATTIYPRMCCLIPDVPASFLLVEEGRAADLQIQLRAQDVSRQALTWGTELPVVREADASAGTLTLSDVPIDPRFRLLLRVYDLNSSITSSVRVRIYRISTTQWNPDESIVDPFVFEVPLVLTGRGEDALVPGYAQLDLGPIQELSGLERIRVEVIATSPSLRFWAFVSVTNNETQHFTTITPQ